MYHLSLPILVVNPRFEQYFDKYMEKCRQAGVDRIFLCVSRCVQDPKEKLKEITLLHKYLPKVKEMGFEAGIWLSSLGHGGTCEGDEIKNSEEEFTYMEDMDGNINRDSNCPLDPVFQNVFCDWIRQLARTGPSIILLDDDYRFSIRGGRYFCCCSRHRSMLEKELGEPFDADRMEQALTTGGPNPWRDAWLKVQGESLKELAGMLRKALDEVDDTIRLAHCAVLSTWDIEGVDSMTLAKIFAGNTRPLLRLIGAPYWAGLRSFRQIRLSAVCEYERLQQSWNENHELEVFCEGDVYPRPRYTMPAAYLEGFDQVMRASGTCDGILKYMIDYAASPDYETGYLEKHEDDKPLFEALTKAFEGKQAVGVTVFEPIHTLAASHDPGDLEERLVPASIRFATDNSLPIRYDAGEDAAIIFGDSAELAGEDELAHGAVLDYRAARILARRGIDVGITGFGEEVIAKEEEYLPEKEFVCVVGGRWMTLTLSEGAQVQSRMTASKKGEDMVIPASYTYENARGQRFLVYAFDARNSVEMRPMHGTFRGWCRAAQLRRILPWLSGRPLDAVCEPSPDLYVLVKRDQDSMTVGLWNFCEDYVRTPKIRLGENWKELICEWGNAVLEDGCVTLDKLPSFGCTCFTVKK